MGEIMKYKIKLTPKAKHFIEVRKDNLAYYSKRGGSKEEDLVVGVYAELAVYKYLKEKGIDVKRPDFSIHVKKSFGADLTSKTGNKYHVKGQSLNSKNKYGSSWLLQRSDRIVRDQLNMKNEFIICCSVDILNETVEILLEKEIPYCKFGECRLEWFRATKVALYLEDNI
jgi:hypothetical protein